MRAVRIAGRIAAWTLLAVVVLAAAGAGVFVLTFDTQAAVARLQAQVRRATGRDLLVGGPVRLAWSWPPEVLAERVALANPPGDTRPAMVAVDQVRARVALRPLLSGRAELDVTLVHPDLELDRGNLRFTPEPAPAAGPAGPSRPPLVRVALRRLRVVDGRYSVPEVSGASTVPVPEASLAFGEDGGVTGAARLGEGAGEVRLSGSAGPGGWPLHVGTAGAFGAEGLRFDAVSLDAPAPGAPAHLRADVAVRGEAVSFDLAALPSALDARAAALPFTLTATSAGATLTAGFTLAAPWPQSGFDATVSVRIPDLPALSALAGTALPAVGAVSLDGRVLVPPGVPGGLAIRSLRIGAAPGNLAGDVAVRWAGTPSLRGTLTSSHLDVDAILAALPRRAAPSAPAASAPTPVPAAPAPPARVIPDRPLDVAALRDVDLDLTATLTDVVLSGQAITGLDAHATAGGGHGRLDPLAVILPAGRVSGTASVDAAAVPPAWSLDVHGPGLRLDRVTDAVRGTADLDATLTATGASTGALAASLDGSADLRLLNGDVDNRLLLPLLDAALRAAHVTLDLSGRSALRCLLLPLTAAKGVVSTPGLLLDTSRVRVEGEGTADLAAETLALQLRPTLSLGGGASVEAPVRVSGPFVHPAATLGDASGRTGLRIGLGAHRADPDACGPDPAGAAAVPAPGKPADLLRSLLR